MSAQVKVAPISPSMRIGEGPFWVEEENALIFVDLLQGNLYRYFCDSERIQKLHVEDVGTGGTSSFIIPVDGRKNEFVVGIGKTLAAVTWSPDDPDEVVQKPRPLLTVENHDSKTRFNDAKCDSEGRLFGGTMSTEYDTEVNVSLRHGSLFRIDTDLKHARLTENIAISNGLCWSSDKKIMYFIDSLDYTVDAFDYDLTTGNIENKRVVIDFKTENVEGFPDGMEIDTKGNLWVACYGGCKVICVDPHVGKVAQSVEIPSFAVTSCCWGGPDYATLFVTSGNKNILDEEMAARPHTGKTFAVTGINAKGYPGERFKLSN